MSLDRQALGRLTTVVVARVPTTPCEYEKGAQCVLIDHSPHTHVFTMSFSDRSLIESLMNCPLCKGKEAVACFRGCRDLEQRTWVACLDRCVPNPLLRSMSPRARLGQSSQLSPE